MTTTTQTSPSPFARLTLMGRGSQSPNLRLRRDSARRGNNKDEDYIPYNGPYEEPPRRKQEQGRDRDSWGDPLYDEDGNAVIQQLHQRYAPGPSQNPWQDEDEQRKTRPRAHSGVSSSGTVDPHRSSTGTVLRKGFQHHANVVRPPVPSYINLDASGGVGESPVQPARVSQEVQPPKRTSLASIFTFGKKVPPTSPSVTSPLLSAKHPRVFAAPHPRPPSLYSVSISAENHKSSASYTSHEDDPFRASHHFTPTADQFGQLLDQATSPHPYAYNFPRREIPEPPQTAPLITSPKLKFIARVASPPVRSLKNYASTPNLRDSARSPGLLRKALPKGKDRWLSPETWCDAIMFPRPRLKIEDTLRGRIVSPPGSPIIGGFAAPSKPEGMASRVLAHSRSMVNLNAEAGPSKLRPVPVASPPPPLPSITTERPPRPKSFALDDLALPSPVPSLARVLEEGQILEHQRKKWQMQAAGSFQNTRSRSLSRARAKSLTSRARTGQSNMDFLAARSLLGNQDTIPVLPVRNHARSGSQSGTNTQGTSTLNTRSSHSHSNSLVKTVSKSSGGNGHSRQESWSRTAIKKAAAICHVDGSLSPAIEQVTGLESALRDGGTKVIRLADPAMIPVDRGTFGEKSLRNGVSPTPSGTSDAHKGIALSTPPPNDNSSDQSSLRLPSHPYAQSYSYQTPPTSAPAQRADYAGPHATVAVVNPDPQDFATRHRLPPQATLAYHPYASPSSRRDSYQIVPQPRADSDVPGPSKMWAQLSPGPHVREILPGDLLYSPFMSERSESPDDRAANPYVRNRKSTATILDSVGLGEALAYAMEEENFRDSGLGTSEDHTPPDPEAAETQHPYRVHRKPVQYDISGPPYTPHRTDETNRTYGSSSLDPNLRTDHRLTPPTPPLLVHHSPSMNSSSSSPPRSPPPIVSADDIDDFQDLFYRPNLTDEVLNNLSRPSSTRQPSLPWDLASTTRTQRTRTGSGLTSLARQLSQEFEEMRAMRTGVHSMHTESSISRFSRFPLENDIHFVFADSELSRGLANPDRPALPDEAMSAFHPSSHLPEDVESSRASSPIDAPPEEDVEDETFRIGSVGSMVATPPTTSGDHRTSYMGHLGQMGSVEVTPPLLVPKDEPRVVSSGSGLHPPPSADPTRSSYLTESTMSRISQLSDFPVPPPQSAFTPAHMSLLNSYFTSVPEDNGEEESQSVTTFAPPRVGERF
ncbi:hypothetical protein FB45DRAFT_1055233 [Roridomyces roridus]|uniref:Uncharacterized protein n=1 Tax=Roridomyces roridus TaxID=1738132 RepID=A0AAD7C4U8_9AGAR|nr:hypothetical protein FB45DRAFT_1055233 [Roridomyces roridus]